MKENTKNIIRKSLDRIKKGLRKSKGNFNAKHIHSTRIEVKKMRSFLQLLSGENKGIRIPSQLKKAYKLLGKIRLIQLQQQSIHETTMSTQIYLPDRYLTQLENEKARLKKIAKRRIKNLEPLKLKK